MEKKKRDLPKLARVGIAHLGSEKARTGVEHRVDDELGTILLTEARVLIRDDEAPVPNSYLRLEVASTAAEVLSSHLANYLGSDDQKGKVSSSTADFAGFIRQSIVGTDPIVIDTALHAQVAGSAGHVHIAKLDGKGKADPSFNAVGLQDTLPSISCDLEVVVLYRGGAHIAHRGQSRQYLLKKDSVEQITEDYNVGGLLGSLDTMGEFLPKVELRQFEMTPQDRIVIFSQGAFPKGHKFDLSALLKGQNQTPQNHATAIAQRISRYNAEGGYVIVIEGIDENTSQSNGNHLARLSLSPTFAASAPPQTPPWHEEEDTTVSRELNTPENNTPDTPKTNSASPEPNTRTKTVLGVATPRLSEQSKRNTERSHPAPARSSGLTEAPFMPNSEAVQQPQSRPSLPKSAIEKKLTASPNQQNAAFQELGDSKPFSPAGLADLRSRMRTRFENELEAFEQEMYQLLEEKMASMGQRIAAEIAHELSSSQDLLEDAVGLSLEITPISPPDLPAHENEMGWRRDDHPTPSAISDHPQQPLTASSPVSPLPPVEREQPTALQKRKRLFARPWVIPMAMGGLILLLVPVVILLGGKQNAALAKSVHFSTLPAVQWSRPSPSSEAVAATEQPSVEPQASDGEETGYVNGPPKNRDDAYAMGRDFYVDADTGTNDRGRRLSKKQRIHALLSAIPYLEFALDTDAQNHSVDPDAWFLLARTHYILAKLGHERTRHAAASLEAFMNLQKQVPHVSKKKQQTIKRNMRMLSQWLI